MFAAKYQLKRVTVAILNCSSFQFILPYGQKGKPLNKQCFYQNNKMFCGSRVRMLSFGIDTCSPAIVLPLVYCSVDDTLYEVSSEIRCSRVSSRYCCYGNHTAGSKLIKKLFIVVSGESNKV